MCRLKGLLGKTRARISPRPTFYNRKGSRHSRPRHLFGSEHSSNSAPFLHSHGLRQCINTA